MRITALSIALIQFVICKSIIANNDPYVPNYVNDQVQINKTLSKHKNNGKYNESNLSAKQALAFNDAVSLINNQIKPTHEMMSSAHKIKDQSTNIVKKVMRDMTPYSMKKQHIGKLYYFISFSMPNDLIKGYIKEAMWTNGIIVIRGMDPHYKKLINFINSKIVPLVHYKGAHPAIEIDPNKFDGYNITNVPTIVYSTLSKNTPCIGFKDKSGYEKCNPYNPNRYWKISGQVSTYYALEQFKKHGANVNKILNHLIHTEGGYNSDKKATIYKGKLKDIPQPVPPGFIKNLLNQSGLAQTKTGIIGKMDLVNQVNNSVKREK